MVELERLMVMKAVKRIIKVLFFCGVVCIFAALAINHYVVSKAEDSIITYDEALKLEEVDCILVLGAGVRDDGTPSPMLADRLETGIKLYKNDAAEKFLMSGDHGRTEYDEVNTMKKYAVDKDVPAEDVFMDHAGFSTYESLYRAKDIFLADKVIIVTQKYHLYRALFVAEKLGIAAYGVPADLREYSGQSLREIREILARCKDFFTSIFKPAPTYLGDVIPVSGDGNATNDKYTDYIKEDTD